MVKLNLISILKCSHCRKLVSKGIMTPLELWAKEMGWCQTRKLNFWKNGSYDEFMGVSDGYFCMLMDWRGRILLRVHFFSENTERAKEIKLLLKRYRDSLPKCSITIRDNAVTLTFGSFLFFFQNKLNRAKAALPAIISLLRNSSVRPSAICACGRQDGLKCVLESDGAVHIRCPECEVKVESAPVTTENPRLHTAFHTEGFSKGFQMAWKGLATVFHPVSFASQFSRREWNGAEG